MEETPEADMRPFLSDDQHASMWTQDAGGCASVGSWLDTDKHNTATVAEEIGASAAPDHRGLGSFLIFSFLITL